MDCLKLLAGLSLAAALLVAGIAAADDFRAEMSVDRRNLGVGETLTLTITVYGGDKISEPDLGVLDGFRIVGTSSSRNINIVNMKMTRSLSLHYTLSAVKEGEYVLGPFTVRSEKETYETGAINVTVSKGPMPSRQEQPRGAAEDDIVLVAAAVDKKRAYVGQQITYTFTFAYRVRLLDDTQYLPPEHTGFWFEDVGEIGPSIETINDKRYYVLRKRTAFFPISSGRFTIGEAGIRYVIRELDPFSGDPFSLFGRDPFSVLGGSEHVAKTKPIEIEVLPLPSDGKPADFSGAVGTFDFSVTPSATEVMVGESVTLSARVRGSGNIKSIGDIPLPEIRDFRVFAPKARASVNVERMRVGGEKVFDLVLVPQRPGRHVLEDFRFSYFDPDIGAYVSREAPPVEIEVLPADESLAGHVAGGAPETRMARQDIRYIKRVFVNEDQLALSLGGVRGLVVRVTPVVLAFVGIVVSIQRKRTASSGRARARRAFRGLMRDLTAAERILRREGDVADASAVAARAIRRYIGTRMGMGESVVDEALVGSMPGVSAEVRSEISEVLAFLDRIRFAPVSADSEEMARMIGRATEAFKAADKQWK